MDIAFASDGSTGGGFAAFIPLLVLGLIPAFLFKSIAKRKGRSQWLWFLAGFVPLYGWFAGIWLASLPDTAISEEVKALINELKKFDFMPKGSQTTSTSSEPQTWKCRCGNTNDMNISNCPECGLKRDFVLLRQQR